MFFSLTYSYIFAFLRPIHSEHLRPLSRSFSPLKVASLRSIAPSLNCSIAPSLARSAALSLTVSPCPLHHRLPTAPPDELQSPILLVPLRLHSHTRHRSNHGPTSTTTLERHGNGHARPSFIIGIHIHHQYALPRSQSAP